MIHFFGEVLGKSPVVLVNQSNQRFLKIIVCGCMMAVGSYVYRRTPDGLPVGSKTEDGVVSTIVQVSYLLYLLHDLFCNSHILKFKMVRLRMTTLEATWCFAFWTYAIRLLDQLLSCPENGNSRSFPCKKDR